MAFQREAKALLELRESLNDKADDLRRMAEVESPTARSNDLWQKTGRLSKALRSPVPKAKQKRTNDDGTITIQVCSMEETSRHLFARSSSYHELVTSRSASYAKLLEQAKAKFTMHGTGKQLALFKANGVIIDRGLINCAGVKKRWSIGSYLQFVAKRSPANMKIGVGYTAKSSSQSSAETGPRCSLPRSGLETNYSPVQQKAIDVSVKYLPKSLSTTVEKSRDVVWQELGNKLHDLDKDEVFYPEEVGYFVSCLAVGENFALGPVFDKLHLQCIASYASKNEFCITYQSPQNVVVSQLSHPIPLVCVSSFHATTTYNWKKLGEVSTFPSTPVIFVKEIGLYQCTLECAGNSVDSLIISVEIKPGTSPPDLLCSEDVHVLSSSSSSVSYLHSSHGGAVAEQSKGTDSKLAVETADLSDPAATNFSSALLKFTPKELDEATGGFSDDSLLGKGGFGTVYRGVIRGTKVAVKRLTGDGEKQLKPEVNALAKFRHGNIVELMGYCPTLCTLVFELMEQGSLLDLLHEKKKPSLSWNSRCKILKDACHGLVWLHRSVPQLIHQDVKTANILIDRAGTGKLGDFGFALELPESSCGRTVVTAPAFARTNGYYAPELVDGQLSAKCDVYSFGVVYTLSSRSVRMFIVVYIIV